MKRSNSPSVFHSAVTINLLNRLISLVGGAVLTIVIVLKLSPLIQGFYYTFYSLIFMRFFAELGLTVAVVQFISHLSSQKDTQLELAALTRFFVLWFAIAGLVITLVLAPAILFYSKQIELVPSGFSNVVVPWIFLSISTGFSVFLVGLTSIVEGHRRILEASRVRLVVSFANFTLSAGLFAFGFELWALPVAALSSVILGFVMLRHNLDVLAYNWAGIAKLLPKVNWKESIWPFQWRLAASWISGFFIFYFLTPFIMQSHGPVAAGQLGLSLQLVQIMNSVGIIAVSTNSAVFGSLVATRQLSILDQKYIRSMRVSFLFLFVMFIFFWAIYAALPLLNLEIIRARLVPWQQLALLMVAGIGTHVFFLLNYYLRSYKDESLWWISTANAVTTLVFSYFFIPNGGNLAAVVIFTANSILFWVVLAPIFLSHRLKTLRLNSKDIIKNA